MGRMVCIGDSNTWGYDPRSCLGGRYEADARWTGLLSSAGWDVVNLGQNGAEILRREITIQNLRTRLEALRPMEWVTVMLGSNDLLMGFSPERAAERMEAFLTALSGFPLLLIAPPRMQRGAWVESDELVDASAALAAQYQALAQKLNVRFLDAGSWNVELTFDGVHFSPAGHRAFAEGLRKSLQTVCQKKDYG